MQSNPDRRTDSEDLARGLLTNVLVATDLSAGAELAVARALRLPCVAAAKLSLLHVVPGDTKGPVAREEEALLARRFEEARARAAIAADRLGIASLDIIPSMARGRAFREIIRAARQQRSELVVLGRHGKSSVEALRLGSTAEGVIRKSGAPVLVVSQPVSGPYRRPLVAVDFSETSRSALGLALRLTDTGTSRIDVVHALGARDDELPAGFAAEDSERAARVRLEQFLAAFTRAGIEWDTVIARGDPREVIVDAAAWRGCDLIVLGARGHSAFDRFRIGSVAEAVVRAARCDVLVVKPAEDPRPAPSKKQG